MSIKIGCVFDYLGDLDEETETARRMLSSILHQDIEVVCSYSTMHQMYHTSGLDILVLDYGGVQVMNCDGAAVHVYGACEYADLHPSCLVIIWSRFTAMAFYEEIEEQFGHLNNVIIRDDPRDNADILEHYAKFERDVQAWFGM